MQSRFEIIRGGKVSAHQESVAPPFEEAVLQHIEALYAFALRLLGGKREQAEDLVQETCLRAFRAYSSLRSPEKLKPWFFKILVNTYINEFYRPAQKVIDVELSDSLLSSAPGVPVPTPEELLFEGLLDGEIQKALNDLPVEFRSVVWLADVEELSYLEIADIAQCPPGTVASRLYRAHSLLRERLREFARSRGHLKE